jgi:hypothetical protein
MAIISLFKIITKQSFHGNAGAAERIALLAAGARSDDEIT